MNKIIRSATLLALLVSTTSAFAHGKLVTSTPANGANLDRSPSEVRMQFSEPVEVAFTTVKLIGPASKEVPTGVVTLDKSDATTVAVSVPALSSGSYRADWTMVGSDGHKIKGTISFAVK